MAKKAKKKAVKKKVAKKAVVKTVEKVAKTPTKKAAAPKKSAALKVVNGRVELIATSKAPAHKSGAEINVAENTAKKMIALGWAKVK